MSHDGANRSPSVLMLTDNLELGGVQTVVIALSKGLQHRGYKVAIAAEARGDLRDSVPLDVTLYAAPPRNTAWGKCKYFAWLTHLVRSGNFDIVHAHQRGVALQARLARARSEVRVVEHVHNTFTPNAFRYFSFRGDHLIACGRAIKEMLVNEFHRSGERISVIHNSVEDWGVDQDVSVREFSSPVKLLVVARVTAQKDPHRFIEVVSILNERSIRVNATWVGPGEMLQECVDAVHHSGVPGLHFIGASRDVKNVMQDADLVLLTSRWEGLPLTLLEAASVGRALVAPDAGSCSDIIDHGVNGFLFNVDSEARDIAALVEGALKPNRLRRMGIASRQLYLTRFAEQDQLARVEAVYAHVRAK